MTKSANEILSLTRNLLLLELLAQQELNAVEKIEQQKHEPLFPEWRTFPTGAEND